jgi:hypothetical protein
MSNFTRILSEGDELLQSDGRTNVTNLIVASRNFINALKKLDCFVLSTSQRDKHWRSKMKDHQICLFLHVIGSTNIFLVCGLGDGDKDNTLREIHILYGVIHICGFGFKGNSSDHNPEHLHWKNKIVIPLLLSSWLLKEKY